MTPQETFVTRLRRHRQRYRISLEQMAADAHVKVELLEALERNDLSAWPRGLYARAWIRAYAEAVGLDPVDTVNQFCRLFSHGDRRAAATIQEIAAIVAAPSEYRDEFEHSERRRRATDVRPRMSWHAALLRTGHRLRARLAALRTGAFLRPRRSPHTSG